MRTERSRVAGRVDTPSDSFIQRFADLAGATPRRGRDLVLRLLDVTLSAFFLVASIVLTLPLAFVLVATQGLPLFYRGERIGRRGRIFYMLKFRTLRRGAEERLGPYLGEELVRRTRPQTTLLG